MAVKSASWLGVLVAGIIFFQGCVTPIGPIGCGELKSESMFDSHALMSDRHTVLFTAHKRYSYLCEECNACRKWARSLNPWLIGTYDIYSHQVKILHHFPNSGYSWTIESMSDSRALIWSDPYYFLDFSSNRLIPLPLKADLTQRGLSLEEVAPNLQLLDEEGTILILQPVAEKLRLNFNTSENEYWVRHPDGNYKRLGIGADAIYLDSSIYLWSYETRRPTAYSLKTRTFRPVTGKQYDEQSQERLRREKASQPDIYVQSQMFPGSRLEIGYRHGKDWKYEMSPIAAEDLDW